MKITRAFSLSPDLVERMSKLNSAGKIRSLSAFVESSISEMLVKFETPKKKKPVRKPKPKPAPQVAP